MLMNLYVRLILFLYNLSKLVNNFRVLKCFYNFVSAYVGEYVFVMCFSELLSWVFGCCDGCVRVYVRV
jgi:hypothetical protein